MKHERNVEGLRQNALRKRQEAIERTKAGIRQLLKKERAVNFKSVAEVAGVSTAWLYKEPEIKAQIEHLRKQQTRGKKLPPQQRASDASKNAMIKTLKERIKKLEAENRGLRDHIEVVQGIAMQVKDLNKQIGVLTSENSKLKEQLDKCLASSEVKQTTRQDSKITFLNKKEATSSHTSHLVQSKLDELGIKVNSTLDQLIEAASEEMVLKAIDALREAETSYEVHNPSGFLVEAIKNTWTPNEGYEQKVELDVFNQWYPLAQSLNLVQAATQLDGVQHVLNTQGKWVLFSQIIAEYPLNKLRETVNGKG